MFVTFCVSHPDTSRDASEEQPEKVPDILMTLLTSNEDTSRYFAPKQ